MTKPQIANLTAQTRNATGTGAARALRREGKVPAVLYSNGKESTSLTLTQKEVTLQYMKGRFQSRLIQLELDGKPVKALPQAVQLHPVTDIIEHVDFLKVDDATTIRVHVPVKFLNQERSSGIKRGGVLNIVRHNIEFECHPDAIPEYIEVDILNSNIGDSIHIEDIQLPDGVISVIKRNYTIATIAGRSTSEEKEETTTATAEGAAAPAAGAAAAKAAPAKEEKK